MRDHSLVLDQISEVEEAIRRIERRFQGIASAEEFVADDAGVDRLDGIAMMLIAIGENIKKIDKTTDGKLLERFPEIHWPGVKGTRDILARLFQHRSRGDIQYLCQRSGPLKRGDGQDAGGDIRWPCILNFPPRPMRFSIRRCDGFPRTRPCGKPPWTS